MKKIESDEQMDNEPNVDTETRKPTLKQEKFVSGIIDGKSMHKAALDAGYSPWVASTARQNIYEKPRVQEEIMRRLGSEAWLARVPSELWKVLCEAKKPSDRLGAIDRWMKLTGAAAAEKLEVTETEPAKRNDEYREIIDMIRADEPGVAKSPSPPRTQVPESIDPDIASESDARSREQATDEG